MALLLIAEKPKVADKIANAIGDAKKHTKGKVRYYEVETDRGTAYVAPAVGHMYTLEQVEGGRDYPVFNIQWAPTPDVEDSAKYMKQYINVINSLCGKVEGYVNACDYDVEGSVIGFNALKHGCNAAENRIERMHFSTLTPNDLREEFHNLEDFDKGQTEAGLTRHVLDWYLGINLSRALMSAIKTQDRFHIMSTGRVQGPALKILVDKEKKIQAFEPEPYWQIVFHGGGLEALHEKDKIWEQDAAENIHATCEGEDATITDVERRRYKHYPPNPFNLTDLQTEAYKLFNYKPKKTQQIAQSLYEKGVISYPRTSSQKLPPKIGYKAIIEKLGKLRSYGEHKEKLLAKKKLYPNQGKKKDDAHPAIYPTGQHPGKLSKQDQNVYDLIVKRFFATFGDAAVRESMKITLDVEGHAFHAKGKKTVEKNWHELYAPYVRLKEVQLPEVKKGATISQKDLELLEKETQSPKR